MKVRQGGREEGEASELPHGPEDEAHSAQPKAQRRSGEEGDAGDGDDDARVKLMCIDGQSLHLER